MRYYVVSDVHSYFTPMQRALERKGFFDDTEPHKLILCGDMMDRGNEVVETQNFMLNLLEKGDLIFIRGNHEDLLVEMIENFSRHKERIVWGVSHHVSNGTFNTALRLSGMSDWDAFKNETEFKDRVIKSPFYSKLIPASINYYETPNYVFVHGWIPFRTTKDGKKEYNPDWRAYKNGKWDEARWVNGMDMSKQYGINEPNKTIVCGHWHASYGHWQYGQGVCEFGSKADFSPFYSDGIIAIDACTAYCGRCNCIVIDD